MRTASMKQRLQVWQPVNEKDGYGDTLSTFVPYNGSRPIPAERRKESGSFRSVVNEQYSDYRAEYYVYYQHRISDGWKIKDCETGIEYIVANHFPDRSQNIRRLVCERINA